MKFNKKHVKKYFYFFYFIGWINNYIRSNFLITLNSYNNYLKPGLFVKLELILDKLKLVARIPERCVVKTLDKTIVFKTVKDKAVETNVKLGSIQNGYVAVLSGLAKGDVVVTAGQNKLQNGKAIVIVNNT